MNRNGLLIWVLAGAGILFLYAGIKNVTPQSVLTAQLGNGGRVAINASAPATLSPQTIVLNSSSGWSSDIVLNPSETDGIKAQRGYSVSPKTYIPPAAKGRIAV